MNDHNEDLSQPDEGDLLRDKVSDEALEAASDRYDRPRQQRQAAPVLIASLVGVDDFCL
jgi:hypothetical protein